MSNPRATLTTGDLILTGIISVAIVMAVPLLFPQLQIISNKGFWFSIGYDVTLIPVFAQGISAALLLLTAGATILLNRHFNFIRGTDNSFAALLVIFCSTNPLTVAGISSPLILLALALVILFLLFESYKSFDATQPLFLAAAVAMTGGLFNMAALILIPIIFIGMFIMNIVRWRELAAVLMGLFTPWWILTGFGLLNPLKLPLPALSIIGFNIEFPPVETAIIISIAFTVLIALFFYLNNSFSLLSGNIRTRAFNRTITSLGLLALIFMMIDSRHLGDYTALLYLTAALQTGNFFSIHNFRYGRRVEIGIIFLYLCFFGVFIYMSL